MFCRFFFPVAEVKKKWKSLRDSFRRELKRCYEDETGKGSETMKPWPFFSQMSFLMDTIAPKKSQSSIEESFNISVDEEATDDIGNTAEVAINASNLQVDSENCINDNQEPQSSLPESPKHTTAKNKPFKSPLKKKKKIDYDEKLLEIENKKLSCVAEAAANSRDSDFQFLTSLLPYLREVPNHKKLKIRAEILNVLIKEQEERNTTVQSRAFEPIIYPPERPASISSYTSSHSTNDDTSGLPGFWENFNPTN